MSEQCEVCFKNKFKYTCPKCCLIYCSVECYKSPQHLKCSEEFYKNCIREELTTATPNSNEDVRKIYDILKRIRQSDAGMQPGDDFEDGLDEPLDSDDEPAEKDCEVEEAEEDIATRLRGVDINDADEVWDKLTSAERQDFQHMIDTGDITKLLPDFKPWWQKRQNSKIVDLTAEQNQQSTDMPTISLNIPKFTDICKKTPSHCLHYNLWNIMAAYACTVRFFGGEQKTSPWEATSNLINLSTTLKYNTNFEEVEDALVSVQIEGLDTVDLEQLKKDAKQLMTSRQNKLLALSDTLQLLQLTKQHVKSSKKEVAEFKKLFAMCSGNVELNRKKLQELVKKIEFMLAYVMREAENELNEIKTK